MTAPKISIEADCSLDEFDVEDIIQYLKELGYVFACESHGNNEPNITDLVRLLEEKIPDAIVIRTNLDDLYSVIAGKKKHEGKGCATIIVLPGSKHGNTIQLPRT